MINKFRFNLISKRIINHQDELQNFSHAVSSNKSGSSQTNMAEHYYGARLLKYWTKEVNKALVLQSFGPGITASITVLITPWRPRLHLYYKDELRWSYQFWKVSLQ